MSFSTGHIDMLETQIIDNETIRIFCSISWDLANKRYVFGLRVYYVEESRVCETIYLDNRTLGSITKREPEVCRLLNAFNSHQTKPVKNYNEAYQLCNLSLNAKDRRKWGACEFEIQVSLEFN